MRIKRGSVLIALGLLMLALAGGLSAYNLYDEYQAGVEARQALEAFDALLYGSEAPTSAGLTVESAVPAKGEYAQQPVFHTDGQQTQPALQNGAAAQAADSGMPAQEAHAGGYEQSAPQAQPRTPDAQSDRQTLNMGLPDLSFGLSAYDEIEIPDYILNPDMDMPVRKSNGQEYIGVLEIPALTLTLPVISEWNYDRLRKAPCRYAGSAYTDNLVIAAHNYKTHFGDLKRLNPGDAVIFTDAVGNRFEYEVALTETLMPRDVQEMKSAEFALSLFTCTVGGSYRVTVRCDRVR